MKTSILLGTLLACSSTVWADGKHKPSPPVNVPPPKATSTSNASANAKSITDASAKASQAQGQSIDVDYPTAQAILGMGNVGDSGRPSAPCYFPVKPGQSFPFFGRSARYARDEECMQLHIAQLELERERIQLERERIALERIKAEQVFRITASK